MVRCIIGIKEQMQQNYNFQSRIKGFQKRTVSSILISNLIDLNSH